MKLYAYMRGQPFSSIEVMGQPVGNLAPGQPEYFIPLFKNREDAVAFAGGEDEIVELYAGKVGDVQ